MLKTIKTIMIPAICLESFFLLSKSENYRGTNVDNFDLNDITKLVDIMEPSDKDHASSSKFIWGYVFK